MAEFADSDERPSPALVNLVGGRLTDMRLIRNIRNEFEIYRTSVWEREASRASPRTDCSR